MKTSLFFGLVITVVLLLSRTASANCFFCYEGGCYTDDYSGRATCLPAPPGSTSCTMGPACGIGGGGCFAAGAKVETADGQVPIEEIEAGDVVVSMDERGQRLLSTVQRSYRTLSDEFLLINGSMRVTRSHPFWVDGNWVNAGELIVGDRLTDVDGSVVLVNSVDKVYFGVRVYNIEVEGTHTFFVDGVLVHNKPPDPDG